MSEISGRRGDSIQPPKPISEFFTGAVQRLMQDNLDYVLSGSWGSRNIEALSLIDPSPVPGEYIRYHHVYELFDTRDVATGFPLQHYGLIIARRRRNVSDHYFGPEHGGAIVEDHIFTTGVGYLRNREILEGEVEDPAILDDPLDSPEVQLLKADIANLQRSNPVRPETNLINTTLEHFANVRSPYDWGNRPR